MKKTILSLLIVLVTTTICDAQKIEMEKVFGGYKYTQNGIMLTMNDLVKTMESNQQAFELIKEAQSCNVLASIIGGAGGALIGFPLGTAAGGGEANWTLAGIGAGLVVIGIPISSKVNKKSKRAVEIYNTGLDTTSFNEFKPEFKILANGNGIGLSMRF